MKHILTRGVSAMISLALACSLIPCALAQSAQPEETVETVAAESVVVTLTQQGDFSEGLIPVTDGTLWGYADTSGSVIIPLQFDAAESFSLGAAQVVLNGKTGLLHRNGTFLLEPVYDGLTKVGYGVYLGQRGALYDLLSINAFHCAEGMTQALYSDLTSATLSTGVLPWLTLQEQSGATTRMTVNSMPLLLSELQVPGWQFPLSPKQAAFQDVTGSDWYDLWADLAYSTGLMRGTGNNMFEPLRTLTVAEALHLAACLQSRALQDDFHLQGHTGAFWYSSSVTYCEAVGLISPGQFSQSDYERPITRAEMADIFSGTTPVRSIAHRNDLNRIKASIPDVKSGDFAADAIYGLYAKGILNGVDSRLSFHPGSSLTRAEAAAVVSRIARPEHRITLW